MSRRPGAAVATPSDEVWPPPTPVAVAPATSRRRTSIVVAAGVLVLLAAVGTAMWSVLPDDSRHVGTPASSGTRGSVTPSGGAAALSPATSPSPSYPAGIDPCLVGTWRQESGQAVGYIGNVPVQYVGASGAVRTFGADGSSLIDYGGSARMTTTYLGDRWETVTRGTIEAKYFADGTTVRWSTVRATGTTTAYRNGQFNDEVRMTAREEPDLYTCANDRLSWTSSQNVYSSEWARVSAATP